MLVTLFSDASICPETGIAAWAAWAKCDRGTVRNDGTLKRRTIDSSLAEAMAVMNGLVIAHRSGLISDGDTVLVQTDCNSVMDVLTGVAKRHVRLRDKIRKNVTFKVLRAEIKQRNRDIRDVAEFYRKSIEFMGVTVRWRHCKGHKGLETKRSAVNTGCDQRAKSRMQAARREHLRQQSNISMPAPQVELRMAA